MSGLPNNATVEMEELSAEEMEVAAKREVSRAAAGHKLQCYHCIQ